MSPLTKNSHSDILNRYRQAIAFWLPFKQRKDILAEITEDLHSQIDDAEASSGMPLSPAQMEEILLRRGRPMLVAGQYGEQHSLVGPVFFPLYRFVLRIVATCFIVPLILVLASGIASKPDDWLLGGFHTLVPMWLMALHLFAAVTVLFAVLDWQQRRSGFLNKWSPVGLHAVRSGDTERRRGALSGVISSIATLAWLLAVPWVPSLLLGPAASYMQVAPAWRPFYPVLLVLCLATLLSNWFQFMRPAQTTTISVLRIAILAPSLAAVWQMLHHPVLFVLKPGVSPQQHVMRVLDIANGMGTVSVQWTWVGLWIGLIVCVGIFGWRQWRGIQA